MKRREIREADSLPFRKRGTKRPLSASIDTLESRRAYLQRLVEERPGPCAYEKAELIALADGIAALKRYRAEGLLNRSAVALLKGVRDMMELGPPGGAFREMFEEVSLFLGEVEKQG